jgi:hypothetical protein
MNTLNMNKLDSNRYKVIKQCSDESLFNSWNDPVYFIKTYTQLEPFQEELIKTINTQRISVFRDSNDQITHTILNLLLYSSIFTEFQTNAILGHNNQRAKKLLEQFKLSYDSLNALNLPLSKIVNHNKTYLEFSNGSKIFAYQVSKTAIRGQTFNYAFLENFSLAPNENAKEFISTQIPMLICTNISKLIITGREDPLFSHIKPTVL